MDERPEAMEVAERAASTVPDVPPERAALVKRWLATIKADEDHWKKVFERMEKCEQLAAEGADETYIQSEQYVVPIIPRHINQSVSQLYAKDPRASATRRKRLMYQLWDGKLDSLNQALQAMQPPTHPETGAPMPPDPITGAPLDMTTGQPWQPDPQALALLQEVQAATAENQMIDKLGKGLELLWNYYTGEQGAGFKEQMKLLVRRTKIAGVGYVKLAFQRELQKRPELAAQIDDSTSQLAALDRIDMRLQQPEDAGGYREDAPEVEESALLAQQISAQQEIVVREGPVFDFPRSDEIIPARKLRHLKTFTGAPHVSHRFHKTADEILEIYKVDVKGRAKAFNRVDGEIKAKAQGTNVEEVFCVYEVQDKSKGQFLTVCEGYPDFLREPAAPDTRIERFWTIFPLVFNEVENKKNPFPPSDVWLLRHTQKAYNSSREGLREHRLANRPGFATKKGALQKDEKAKLEGRPPHAVVELSGLQQGQSIEQLLQRLPNNPIDPSLYETKGFLEDVLRTVGAQEANLGGTSSSTATESSIAEQSRSASLSDNVDDLDDMLTALARSFGQLCLLELSKETVQQIVGPGAVWPDVPQSREDIARDLLLEIKAGSSGRPNKAAELANLERAWPVLSATPGIRPEPVAKKLAALLDIDMEELYADGLPSFNAMNALMGKPPVVSNDPMAQGAQGGANAAVAAQNESGGQPAYPAGNNPIAA